MKNLRFKFAGMVAGVALLLTTFNMNSTCIYIAHQPKLPEQARKLRKF
jgi:cyclic lactone autoinducer peptide